MVLMPAGLRPPRTILVNRSAGPSPGGAQQVSRPRGACSFRPKFGVRTQAAPRSPGHRVQSTGGASQLASTRQADQRGGTIRTPIQRAYPEARGAAQRDAPNDYNYLLQRNFISQNTLVATRVVAPKEVAPGEYTVSPMPGENQIVSLPTDQKSIFNFARTAFRSATSS